MKLWKYRILQEMYIDHLLKNSTYLLAWKKIQYAYLKNLNIF